MMCRKYSREPAHQNPAYLVFRARKASSSLRRRRQRQAQRSGRPVPLSLDELPDAASQDGADQDIRIEDDHFNWLALPRRRNCLNSATSSSSSTSAKALARRSAAALSSERSAVLGCLRGVGT